MRFYGGVKRKGAGPGALLSRAVAAAVLLAFCWIEDPQAAGEVYTVAGVPVDVTAESAIAARSRAIAEGHQKALRRLYRRLVLDEDLSRAPQLSVAEIEALVRDFSVSDERTSSVRYLANMTFRFKPAEVRSLLRQRGLRFAETQSRPMLILPITDGPAGSALWDEPNPWRGAWSARYGASDLVPILAPVGDLADIAAIDAARALAGDRAALAAIARRYGTDRVLISRASFGGDLAGGTGSVEIAGSRFDGTSTTALPKLSLQQRAEEGEPQFLARAANAVAVMVQRSWKARNIIEFGVRSTLPATAAIGSLDQWLAIRQRLDELPTIDSVQLISLSRTEAVVNLLFFGSQDQLSTALAQRGLALSRSLTDDWQISLDRRAQSQTGQ